MQRLPRPLPLSPYLSLPHRPLPFSSSPSILFPLSLPISLSLSTTLSFPQAALPASRCRPPPGPLWSRATLAPGRARRRDSNSGPSDSESCALTTRLHARITDHFYRFHLSVWFGHVMQICYNYFRRIFDSSEQIACDPEICNGLPTPVTLPACLAICPN